jgi:hypothetical protein
MGSTSLSDFSLERDLLARNASKAAESFHLALAHDRSNPQDYFVAKGGRMVQRDARTGGQGVWYRKHSRAASKGDVGTGAAMKPGSGKVKSG